MEQTYYQKNKLKIKEKREQKKLMDKNAIINSIDALTNNLINLTIDAVEENTVPTFNCVETQTVPIHIFPPIAPIIVNCQCVNYKIFKTVEIQTDADADADSNEQTFINANEHKYIDCIKSMLIVNRKFVTIIPNKKNVGKPGFFIILSPPDFLVKGRTECSFVKYVVIVSDNNKIYQPKWDIIDYNMLICDEHLHNIIAFDENRKYYKKD